MNWTDALENFKAHLALERSLSQNTLEAYVRDVGKLHTFLEMHKLDYAPTQVPSEVISSLMAYLNNLGLEANSQSRTLSGLKTFYRFLLLEDLIDVAPTDLIEMPRLAKRIPDVLTVDEVEAILASFDLSTPQGVRHRTMIEVLYACGLRVTELVNLKTSQVYFPEKFIRVTGKGNKERLVPIGDEALKYLRMYLDYEKAHGKTARGHEDVVFRNRNGRKMSRVWVFLVIKEAVKTAGIEKKISPHTFRHTFATHLIEGGADLKVVQDLLGHESITTTEIYTHLDTAYLRETIMMFHPRNKR